MRNIDPKEQSPKQRLIVVSGPSGSGKRTILNFILERLKLKHAVTYTTRRPRPGEVDGEDYNFVTQAEFDQMLANGELIEAEQVYGDFFYGSPRDVFSGADGDVIMELDTKGAANYRKFYPNTLTIFILPPSIDELIARIKRRHPEANLSERLATVKPQLEAACFYDYIVINDDIARVGEEALRMIRSDGEDPRRSEKLALAKKLAASLH
jgi:guanylate kinase